MTSERTAPEPLIELGEDWGLPEERARSRTGRIGPARAASVCAVIALSLGLLGASGAPAESDLSLIGIMPPQSYSRVTEVGRLTIPSSTDDVSLIGQVLVFNWGNIVTGHTLGGGKLWEYANPRGPLPVLVESSQSSAFVLVIELRRGEPSGSGRSGPIVPSASVALDPLTGAQLWRVDVALRPVGEFLVGIDRAGRQRVYEGSPPRLLWQSEPLLHSYVDDMRGTVLGLADEGSVVEYELATGELVREKDLRLPSDFEPFAIGAVAGLILVTTDGRGSVPRTLVYDQRTLTPVHWPYDEFIHGDCGRVICLTGPDRLSRVKVVSPDTRDVLWEADDLWLTGTPAGLLAFDPDMGGMMPPLGTLLDPQTGRVRQSLTGWYVVGSARSEPMVLIEPHPRWSRVAVLGPDGLQVVGAVPYQLRNCRYRDEALFCRVNKGDLGVWKVTLGPSVAR